MSLKTRVGLLAGATALTLTGVSVAGPASDDVAERLAAAEARIAAMEAANNQNWMTEQRAAEIKGLVQDVLADADTRASLLQAGATAGYDNGFIISSTDGNWLLRFNLLMQQRFVWSHVDDPGDDAVGTDVIPLGDLDDENRYGFENTRSKLILSGHLVNPSWFYRLDYNFGSNSLAPVGFEGVTEFEEFAGLGFEGMSSRTGVGNAYLGYDYGNGWQIMLGTMKAPLLREELVEAQYQQAVERSIFNYFFTAGYTDGLAVSWAGEQFRFTGMFSDGAHMGQTVWSAGPFGHADYAFTGRGEFKFSGTWEQFSDFTSPQGGETGIMLGAAAHWQRSEEMVGSSAQPEVLILTGDVSAEFGGFNVYGALVWSDIDLDMGGDDWNPWGFLVQGGFYLSPEWELFGRFEWLDYDAEGIDDLSVLTGGVNYYFAGHNAKWTTDVGYGFNAVTAPAGLTGWRNDTGLDRDGQFVLRTQVQIYF